MVAGTRAAEEGLELEATMQQLHTLLSHGLSLLGFGKKRQKCREALSIRRFQAHYDIGPKAVEQLVCDLKKK